MPRRRSKPFRLAIAIALSGALALASACSSGPDGGTTIRQPATNFVVSYADAASRLSGMTSTDAQDQIRDWASIGLAARLGIDTSRLRDATYDTLPVRDPALADLSRQPTGPGRSLYDGKGVLHILVPADDPHEARTAGLLLDQYRTDSGADAAEVQIHRYTIASNNMTVAITDGPTTPTSQFRAANGYVTTEVDSTDQLASFLSTTSTLSRLELRGTQIWAGGWSWPVPTDARVDITDVSALQRGYTDPNATQTPGFSLDPQNAAGVADLHAVVPGLDPALAAAVLNGNWSGTAYSSADELKKDVDEQLWSGDLSPAYLAAHGLPSDRTQLWALHAQLNNRPLYSQATYYGDLAGTAVGNTLFYDDYVAKNWSVGTGSGNPAKAVDGFVPNDQALTPWGQCTADNTAAHQSGRLWFGADPAGFALDPNDINIGARPAQLYFRSDASGGAEVQPSYSTGKGLAWWEQHFQAVADYEPQYQRLDNIFRWSDALDWLVNKTSATLPQLPDAQIPSDTRFADWYAKHPELRERAPIDFVTPPSAKQEAVSHMPTLPYSICGLVGVSGGVSLSDVLDREGDNSYTADLPPSVARAGLYDPASAFDETKGVGQLTQLTLDDNGQVTDHLKRSFTLDGSTAKVETTGDGRSVDSLGQVKVLRSATAPRTVAVELSARDDAVSEHVTYEGRDMGTLTAASYGDLVTVRWRIGLVDKARTLLESLQNRFTANPGAGIPTAADGVVPEYRTADGRTLYDIGDPGDPYMQVTNQVPAAGNDLVLQIGGPGGPSGPAAFLVGEFVPPPDPHSAWMSVAVPPGGGSGHSAVYTAGTPPDPSAHAVSVTTSDKKKSTVYVQQDDQLSVSAADPILGPDGRIEGKALLCYFPEVQKAMAQAAQAHDGLLRGVPLGGDGVALVAADQIYLAGQDDQWATAVEVAAEDSPGEYPAFLLQGGQALWIGTKDLGHASSAYTTDLGTVASTPNAVIYLNEVFRSSLTLNPGPIIISSLPYTTRVTVREYAEATVVGVANASLQQAILVHGSGGGGGGNHWWRFDNPGVYVSNVTQVPTPSPSPTISAAPDQLTNIKTIIFVCPADAGTAAGCTP